MKKILYSRIAFLVFSLFFFVLMLSVIDDELSVVINDKKYPRDSSHITVTGTIDDYSVFKQFTDLQSIDITSVTISPSDYEKISSLMGEKTQILWKVPVGEQRLLNTTDTLVITPELNIHDASFIKYFKNLKSVDVSFFVPSPLLLDVYNASKDVNPDIEFICNTTVYGLPVDNDTESLVLNDLKITDLRDLDIALTIFPNIKTVDMCSCQVDNESIAALRNKYPDRKIVWLLVITNHRPRTDPQSFSFSIRTDAQIFSTLGVMKHYDFTSEMASPIFRYCTELRGLDLGHNSLTDLSEITNLKNLHTLILADNSITDVSPLAELKQLNYIEIQYNRIKDATPFGELPLLEDLYIVHNESHNSKLNNIIALSNCKNIKRIDISNCGVGKNEIRELRRQLPKDCTLKTIEISANLMHWQMTMKNYYIKQAFSNWKTVQEFSDWEHIVYRDEDLYAKYK